NALLASGEAKRVSNEIAGELLAIAERIGDGERAAAACWIGQEALARQDAGPVFASPEWAMWTERLYRHSTPGSHYRVTADLCTAWTHYANRRMHEYWEGAIGALKQARLV